MFSREIILKGPRPLSVNMQTRAASVKDNPQNGAACFGVGGDRIDAPPAVG